MILAVLNHFLSSALFCQVALWAVLYQDSSGCLDVGCNSQNSLNVLFAITLICYKYHEPVAGAMEYARLQKK